jgi:hypothetical protein
LGTGTSTSLKNVEPPLAPWGVPFAPGEKGEILGVDHMVHLIDKTVDWQRVTLIGPVRATFAEDYWRSRSENGDAFLRIW